MNWCGQIGHRSTLGKRVYLLRTHPKWQERVAAFHLAVWTQESFRLKHVRLWEDLRVVHGSVQIGNNVAFLGDLVAAYLRSRFPGTVLNGHGKDGHNAHDFMDDSVDIRQILAVG